MLKLVALLLLCLLAGAGGYLLHPRLDRPCPSVAPPVDIRADPTLAPPNILSEPTLFHRAFDEQPSYLYLFSPNIEYARELPPVAHQGPLAPPTKRSSR